jgi:hypothetical protein
MTVATDLLKQDVPFEIVRYPLGQADAQNTYRVTTGEDGVNWVWTT